MIYGSSEIDFINVYKGQWDSCMKSKKKESPNNFIVLAWQAAKIHLGGMGTYFPVGKGKNGIINMLSTMKFSQKGAVTFLYEKWLSVRK